LIQVYLTLFQNGDFLNSTCLSSRYRTTLPPLNQEYPRWQRQKTPGKSKNVILWCAVHHYFDFKWCIFIKFHFSFLLRLGAILHQLNSQILKKMKSMKIHFLRLDAINFFKIMKNKENYFF
jgi:hypothetical protein